ncbi:MAG: Dabb family protein [Candidatus Aenigmarchaeota archaeon]|nr:Dabb family protein [Candidatus Aenigmarchaeota archaeon]
MLVHIALFKWKEGTQVGEIGSALEEVRKLKGKVKGVMDIYCGENFSKWAEGFTHAVVVLAKDRDALEAYRKHPDHVDVAERIERMEAKSIGIDFEN